ncbi:DUF6643 family protein [Streptacidiphilus fuscans]|uniref:DUF6643 family protein n=1 Tax=Streptacidiphilus fuscans TaxID=2789292 RepID=UPI001F1DE363|nr:DUF6643 family protein [Streptacidiphilus fuscans]
MTSRSYDGVGYYAPSFSSDTPIYDSLVAERGVPQIAPINVPAALPPASYDSFGSSSYGSSFGQGSNLPALASPRLALGPGPSSPSYAPPTPTPAHYPAPQPYIPQQPQYAGGQTYGGNQPQYGGQQMPHMTPTHGTPVAPVTPLRSAYPQAQPQPGQPQYAQPQANGGYGYPQQQSAAGYGYPPQRGR